MPIMPPKSAPLPLKKMAKMVDKLDNEMFCHQVKVEDLRETLAAAVESGCCDRGFVKSILDMAMQLEKSGNSLYANTGVLLMKMNELADEEEPDDEEEPAAPKSSSSLKRPAASEGTLGAGSQRARGSAA